MMVQDVTPYSVVQDVTLWSISNFHTWRDGTMNAKREETATVGITLRVREDLREHIEQSAKARRVSLNQEIIDRLEHTRDRQGLLREVLELAYGPSLAGVMMVLGMGIIGAGYTEARRRAGGVLHDPDWLDDP